jgi:hypothetical protein
MGSGGGISSVTNAVSDAGRQVAGEARRQEGRGKKTAQAVIPVAYVGNRTLKNMADGQGALDAYTGAVNDVTAGIPSRILNGKPGDVPTDPGSPDAPVNDPTKPNIRRKRQLDSRAGTLLSGGTTGNGTLGDASGGQRSTLLGL